MKSARKGNFPHLSSPWQLDLGQDLAISVDTSCVGIGVDNSPEAILDFALGNNLHHICQKKGHLFEKEIQIAESMIESPDAFLEFPIASVLLPHRLDRVTERGLIAIEEQYNCSSQKWEVLDKVITCAQTLGISQTITDDLTSVSDELFTNSIYNAPFVDVLTHKNPGLSRMGSEVKMGDGKFARLFMALDEGRMLIGCHDPYGSLDLKQYLKKIQATYARGPAATMNFGAGGAGIGSYIIFNAGSSLYFGVWPSRATILCCVLPLGMSNRSRIQLPKHLHWMQR